MTFSNMNIVILNGSPRKDGNTKLLVEAFAEGARQHHQVEIINVNDYHIQPCKGCNFCFQDEQHRCCQKDGMEDICGKLSEADILMIASPMYFYSISAQLKCIIDRLHNPLRDTFHIKEVGLLLVAASSKPAVFEPTKLQHQLLLDFFHLENAGGIFVNSVKVPGDIRNTNALQQAQILGSSF